MRKYLLFLLLLIGSAVHAEELDVVTQAFPNEGAPYPLNAYSQILTGATPTVSTLGTPTDLNTSPGFSMCIFDSRPGFFSQATVYWSPDKITWKASVSKGPGCYFFLARARYVYIASTGAIGSTINVQLATANYMPFTNASGQNLTVTANQGTAGSSPWPVSDTASSYGAFVATGVPNNLSINAKAVVIVGGPTGQQTMANSAPVVLASNQAGMLTYTALTTAVQHFNSYTYTNASTVTFASSVFGTSYIFLTPSTISTLNFYNTGVNEIDYVLTSSATAPINTSTNYAPIAAGGFKSIDNPLTYIHFFSPSAAMSNAAKFEYKTVNVLSGTSY